jgi:SAM-dependent methyltransferase
MRDDAARGPTVRMDGRAACVTACSLCGAAEAATVFTRHDFRYQRCLDCGLVRVSPQLTQLAIADIYRDGYASKSRAAVPVDAPIPAPEKDVLDALARYAGSPGYLLDVGCFEGRFLHAAALMGWRATGTEISPAAVSRARERFGLDVRLGVLEEAAFPNGCFDAVVLFDVVEHLPDPRRTMDEVHRVLRPGGVVYLWTPNFNCLTRRVARARWGAVVFPWHLYYFDARTLRRLAAETGFEPLRVGSRNWLLDFRDRYAALTAGRELPHPPRLVRRARRMLDIGSEPFFAWADRHGRHWGAQIELYARKVT